MIEAVEAIFVECFRSFETLPGARPLDAGGATGVITGIQHNFFNGVGRADDPDVEAVVDFFRREQTPFRWWTMPSSRRGLAAELVQHGMRKGYDSAGMSADLTRVPLGTPPPPGLEIRAVADEAELQHWAEILITGFERPRDEDAVWTRAFAQLGAAGEWQLFIGYFDGAPVATSAALVRNGLVGVYHVVTLPQARGRGIGAAITLAAMQHGAACGATEAVLQASEMGFSVYRALGFEHDCALEMYYWLP